MADMERDILAVLLDVLLGKKLITETVHNKAKNKLNSTLDFSNFLEYSVCCQKEGNDDGCTKNP